MVTAFVSGSSGPGSNPGREHCLVMGNGEFNVEGNSAMD